MEDIYNTHLHTFTGNHAPKDFLQVGITSMGDGIAKLSKKIIMLAPIKWLIKKSSAVIPNKKLQFVSIGIMKSQIEIFQDLLASYDKSAWTNMKMVALTIDMDYMTDAANAPSYRFKSQIEEMLNLKKSYPNRIFPFLGIDPANIEFTNAENIKYYFLNKIFVGIKIYPANGFFPFDPRLDAVYKFASDNNIPIMTHCTRTGSFNLSKNIVVNTPLQPASLNATSSAMNDIYQRILKYKNTTIAEFQTAARFCNIFSHPQNYIPVLEKYPNLKLCLAHLGGSSEIMGDIAENDTRDLFNSIKRFEESSASFYEFIKNNILPKFTNTYADISYSLSNTTVLNIINNDLNTGALPIDRILFGTDYYMVAQEDEEIKIVNNARNILYRYFLQLTGINNRRYLYS